MTGPAGPPMGTTLGVLYHGAWSVYQGKFYATINRRVERRRASAHCDGLERLRMLSLSRSGRHSEDRNSIAARVMPHRWLCVDGRATTNHVA